MEENIEVKDVQKTEYLDKNGLDMLWAKVKENTNNQVEVERNRAVAKENSISDKVDNLKYLPYYNKYTKSEIQYHKLADRDGIELESYTVHTKLSGNDIKIYSGSESSTIDRSSISISSYGSDGNGNHFYVNTNSQPQLNLYDNESAIKATIYTNEHTPVISINECTGSGRGDDLQLSANGIKMLFKTTKDIVTANNSTAHIGLDDDQTEYTYVAPLENGKVPEKYLDLPQIDTSNFVSKTTTDIQSINSVLGIVGGEINIVPSMENTDINAVLASTGLEFNGSDRSTIDLSGKDIDSGNSCHIVIDAYNENPNIMLSKRLYNTGFQNKLTITNEGISSTDNNANHVYATDGSIADLTLYAKKSEITAGGNVDDVQVNGVTVVENKVANIKSATKENLGVVKVGDGLNVADGTISVDSTAIGTGNYIPYESIADDNINYKTYVMKHNEGILFDSASGDVSIKNGEVVVKNTDHRIAVTSSFIQLLGPNDYGEGDDTLLFELNEDGLRLRNGDNNHVLTSYGSTIDITEYVLKSVYNKKIAALEARIAALEAKHAEAV